MTMSDFSAYVYESGTDPLDWAVWLAECQIDARENVIIARIDNPDAYPGYPLETTITATSRAIIGRLLDAGWTPPAIGRGVA